VQPLIEPLVVSWGWGTERPFTTGSDFIDYLVWQGTIDPAAYLSVPDAIRFQADMNGPNSSSAATPCCARPSLS
jgi:isopenicillin-N epimerase